VNDGGIPTGQASFFGLGEVQGDVVARRVQSTESQRRINYSTCNGRRGLWQVHWQVTVGVHPKSFVNPSLARFWVYQRSTGVVSLGGLRAVNSIRKAFLALFRLGILRVTSNPPIYWRHRACLGGALVLRRRMRRCLSPTSCKSSSNVGHVRCKVQGDKHYGEHPIRTVFLACSSPLSNTIFPTVKCCDRNLL
jgi:hypothetical protein